MVLVSVDSNFDASLSMYMLALRPCTVWGRCGCGESWMAIAQAMVLVAKRRVKVGLGLQTNPGLPKNGTKFEVVKPNEVQIAGGK
jgi:hypothetical protein